MKMFNILVADGQGTFPGISEALTQDEGTHVTKVSATVADAEQLRAESADLLVVDLRRTSAEFPPVAEAFRRACPQAAILVAAGETTAGLAFEALRRGACHFVVQPQDDDQFRSIVRRVARGPAANGGHVAHGSQRGAGEGRPTLYEMERTYILRTLEECKWNKKKTASVLGINRSSLYSKIKRFGIGDASMN
jgi:DNA-binding NtrC family response regulator